MGRAFAEHWKGVATGLMLYAIWAVYFVGAGALAAWVGRGVVAWRGGLVKLLTQARSRTA